MKKILYIDETIELIEETLTKLKKIRLEAQQNQEEEETNRDLLSRIDKDVSEIKKGVIG